MQQKLFIFDLDGTLANTLESIKDAVNMCMSHFGYPLQSTEQVRKNIGNGAALLLRRSLPEKIEYEENHFASIEEYFKAFYRMTQTRVNSCYDGIYELIMDFRQDGYKLAVLSNKPDELTQIIIKNIFGDGVFDFVMGQTELPRKPDPTVPKMIAERLGVDLSMCRFIGDSEVDIATARNAGMKSVAVSWGFRDRDMLCGADFIADTPDELREILQKN